MDKTLNPIELSPSKYRLLILHIGRGVTYQTACKLAGVKYSNFTKWYELGQDYISSVEDEVPYEEYPLLGKLVHDINQTETALLETWLDLVDAEARDGNVNAVMFRLKKKFPDDFGDTSNIQITGEGKGPIKHAHSITVVEVHKTPEGEYLPKKPGRYLDE